MRLAFVRGAVLNLLLVAMLATVAIFWVEIGRW